MSDSTIDSILVIFVFVVGITAHEFGHAITARLLGDDTPERQGRISLNPIAHLDLFGTLILLIGVFSGGLIFGWGKPVMVNPSKFKNPRWGDFLVSFAGPFMNLLLAAAIAVALRTGVVTSQDNPIYQDLIYQAFTLNLVLFLFNLIPVPPLDGSHILGALVPTKYLYAYETFISRYSVIGLLIVLFFGGRIIAAPLQHLSSALLGA